MTDVRPSAPLLHSALLSNFARLSVLCFVLLVSACSGEDVAPDSMVDEGGAGAPSTDDELGERTDVRCETHRDCDDGSFCNGEESCDGQFCRLGLPPRCDDGIACTVDTCSHLENRCRFEPADEDGDGHADADCLGPSGEPLGDDCDDDDSNRYPGNDEVCSVDEPEHDEDCDRSTFGELDQDADGFVSAACCNEDAEGELQCGTDCDDEDFRRFPEHPEICDDIDNDCDGEVDVNTREVPWYPDSDGDQYGDGSSDSVMSCAPVDGFSLRGTDCDDSFSAVHGAAKEACDGFDNDCDGDVDEDDVCACAPEGIAQPCACDATSTGIQQCSGSLWGACDCSECISGSRDCLGDLLPRLCVDDHWIVEASCTGRRPLCVEGQCRCADGSDACEPIVDVVAPFLVGSYPTEGGGVIPTDSVVSAVFSEPLLPSSVGEESVIVQDLFGTPIGGDVEVEGATINFVPDAPLAPGMYFTLHLSSFISDAAENPLDVDEAIFFSTESAYVDTRLASEGSNYVSAILGGSPSGSALALVNKRTYGGGGYENHGTFAVYFDGSVWSEGDHLFDSGVAFPSLNDGGKAVALWTNSSSVARYDLVQGALSGSSTSLSSTNSSGEVQVAENAVGTTVHLYQTGGFVHVDVLGENGAVVSSTDVVAASLPIKRGLDVSESGHAGFVYMQDNLVHACSAPAPLTQWSCAEPRGVGGTRVDDPSIAMNEDGTATIAWVEYLDVSGSSYDRVLVQDLDSAGAFVDAPLLVSGPSSQRFEREPALASDAQGRVHLVYEVNTEQWAATSRFEGGAWTGEQIVSAPGDYNMAVMRFFAAPGGEATIVWSQYNDRIWSIWSSRWDGSSWGLPEMIEDEPNRIDEFDAFMDGNGATMVVYPIISEDNGEPQMVSTVIPPG